MPPGSPMPRGLMCRVAIATPCTTARSAFGIIRSTSPRRPLWAPDITTTVSPLRSRAAISQHLGCERHDLGELPPAQLAHHRAEDARADRLHLLGDQHRGIAVEADRAAIAAPHRKRRAHDHRLVHIALLHLAARDRLLDGHHDHVADRGGSPLRTTQHLDALPPPRPGVVGDFKIALDLDHAATPSACVARSASPPCAARSVSPLRSITSHVLRLLSGRHSSMRTLSPILHRLASSCAAYFFDRRMNFLYSGCITRRSTKTVIVLSILSLVTRPLRTRFGISRRSPYSFAAERDFSAMMVFTRAMSRRTGRTRLMPSCWPVARWKRRLNCSLRRSSSIVASSSGVFARTSVALFAIMRLRSARRIWFVSAAWRHPASAPRAPDRPARRRSRT